MRIGGSVGFLIGLSLMSGAQAQGVRNGPVTKEEVPGLQAYDSRETSSRRAEPAAPKPERISPPEEQDAVARANERFVDKAKEDAAKSVAKIEFNKNEQERYAREKAEYEAAIEAARLKREQQARDYAAAMAEWEAGVKACKAGDASRCQKPPPK